MGKSDGWCWIKADDDGGEKIKREEMIILLSYHLLLSHLYHLNLPSLPSHIIISW